jgi:hypothetical protein
MKSFKDFLNESARLAVFPVKSDRFDFQIDACLLIESEVLEHTDTSITVAVDNKAMLILESLDLLEAVNRLERSYDLDLFKDLGDGYWISSQKHVDSDSSKVDLSLYHLVEPRGATDKFAEAWEFINYLSVPTYNPSSAEIEQAGKALKAKHQQNPESATLKMTTSEVAKKKNEPNANISPMAEDAYDSVKNAITHRIAIRHVDLLTKYGLDKVEDAIDSVADFHRDVEEIGSSDISAFVRQVQDTLGHIAEMRRLSGLQIAETVIDQSAIDEFIAKHTANEGDVVAFKRPELKGDAPNLGRAKELARELYWKETSSRNTPEELKAEEGLRNQLAKIGFSAETDFDLEEGENIVLTHKASGKQYPVTGDDLFVEGAIREAKYQGRKVALGKPMRGDVKKYKVYVRNPTTGNIKKVNFGDKDMEIKRDDPARRKNFRARHNCAQKKDRTKAGYWSCRMWSSKPVSKILESFAISESKAQSAISIIRDNVIGIDQISRAKDGSYVFRRGFYYKHGGSSEEFAGRLSSEFTKLGISHKVLGNGEEYKPFRGGASVKNQSHWWVKIRIDDANSASTTELNKDLKEDAGIVKFVVNSEKSMQAVMAQFGDRISWDDDDMTVDAKLWPQVERVAYDADPSPSGGADRIEDLDEISTAKSQ